MIESDRRAMTNDTMASHNAATPNATVIGDRNAQFWDEMCGTTLAKRLGITDSSPASLKKFDDWYMDFYPYLYDHIPFAEMRNRDVLEIGLGYGTVAEALARSGCQYSGLDIAAGPVSMVNHRLKQAGLSGAARQGSVLAAPFPDGSFDFVVAIGCLHHTGDLKLAIDECRRMLRPGGQLIFMVYYAYSYRRWLEAPAQTLAYRKRERAGLRAVVGESDTHHRASYDTNVAGDAAPHTDWISVKSLAALCNGFSSFSGTVENIDRRTSLLMRRYILRSWPIRRIGLDLYATAVK